MRKTRGFTLVEALLASVILAVAVVAVAQAVAAGQAQSHEAVRTLRGQLLAEAMMEEILATSYADPDTDGETGRANFDDIDDFNGFTQAAGALTDAAGVAYPDTYQRCSIAVTVTSSSTTLTDLGGASYDGKNVVVTVTDLDGRTWTLTRFVVEPAA